VGAGCVAAESAIARELVEGAHEATRAEILIELE
jgi:hypothetical protein